MRRMSVGVFGVALGVSACQIGSSSEPTDVSATAMARARIALVAARMQPMATAPTTRSVLVELPEESTGMVSVQDASSPVSVRFSLEDARRVGVVRDADYAVYAGAIAGADVVQRVSANGTEDFVVFDHAPAVEELVYVVDVSRVAGLRLVSNTLELLDSTGTPRLRVSPPFGIDANAARVDARLAIRGCAVDENPSAPWGRPPVAPGAERCELRVRWTSANYPVIVDPAWTATGTLITPRREHVAAALATGKLLVAGGSTIGQPIPPNIASAELFDPVTRTFAATGSMSEGHSGGAANVLASGKVLVSGGYAMGYTKGAEIYDPATGAFKATGPLPFPKNHFPAVTLASGKIMVVGGETSTGIGTAACEIYDPVAGTFTATTTMPAVGYHASAILLPSNQVFVAGLGNGTQSALFDPISATWTFAPLSSQGRSESVVGLLSNGRVLIVGGSIVGGATATTAEIFDPVTKQFSSAGSPLVNRVNARALTMAPGKFLIVGGVGGPNSSEYYDESTSSFVNHGLLGIGRVRFSLSALTGGDILVVGGEDASGKHLDSVEIANLEPLATTCTNGNQCASAFCVDGVCCDKACDGACDACNIAGKVGTCSLRPAQAVAENPTCAPYRCDGKSAGCPKECATTTDCVDGAVCNVTTRTCVASSATCDGDHTTTRANGDKIDCAPYKCDSDGFCKSECRSVSDCASPNACDAAGRCVSPTPSAAEGCSTSGDSGMALGIGVSLVAWLVLLARKRARVRSS